MVRFLKGTTITAVPAQYTFWIFCITLFTKYLKRSCGAAPIRMGSQRRTSPQDGAPLSTSYGSKNNIHISSWFDSSKEPPSPPYRCSTKQKVLVCTRTFL